MLPIRRRLILLVLKLIQTKFNKLAVAKDRDNIEKALVGPKEAITITN